MIPRFTDNEIASIRELLARRFHKDIEINLSDNEVFLGGNADNPTACPAVSWYAQEANFVVIKTGPLGFRTRFYTTPHDQYDTGTEEYDNLEQCITAVLQSQSDHEKNRQGPDSDTIDHSLNETN